MVSSRTELSDSITWLRLLRGRWCLVASSDAEEKRHSRLSIWDSRAESDTVTATLQMRAEMFLPGPIMDGESEDDGVSIKVAVTVGSK